MNHPSSERPLIGAHMSINGGLEQALYRGASIGCTCVQLFTHSNRQWAMKALSVTEIEAFAQARATTGITTVAAHASYLINIGSPRPAIYQQSLKMLRAELLRCEALAIPYLIMHPGSSVTGARDVSIQQIIEALSLLLDELPLKSTMVLLENMAGQGATVGTRLEELAMLQAGVRARTTRAENHLGFCIDTCHAFAAGYDIRSEPGYHDFWDSCDQLLGLHTVRALHLNDSSKGLASRVDRHTHIGEGELGLEPFRRIMRDIRFQDIPKIVETPHTTCADDERNLMLLRKLSQEK